MSDVKDQVRQFYDQIGWQMESDGFYQNARYEDLRPVAREYIHKCHMRVKRHLQPRGRFLLDAGSGPVQYPEYLTYSEGYDFRVCLDISLVALQEAHKRVGERGLYVVADAANLPFKSNAFDGAVSLHTFHHLPAAEQEKAYLGLKRVLANGAQAVVVNGWTDAPLMRRLQWLVSLMERVGGMVVPKRKQEIQLEPKPASTPVKKPTGTFIHKFNAAWLRQTLNGKVEFKILTWRSLSVRFTRAVMHTATGGKLWLRLVFWLEERSPRFFGENGQYPLIVIKK
jgi:ubiquinone/menaquinone biosynthesis C-methylase UbiE